MAIEDKLLKIVSFKKKSNITASVRMRYYGWLENLPKDRYLNEEYTGHLDCDVLYVQKLATKECIKAAIKAREKGILVCYDMDDPIKIKDGNNMARMVSLADVVTVDTLPRAEQANRFTVTTPIIIPDGIDFQQKPEKIATIRENIKSIVTFGYPANVKTALPFLAHAGIKAAYIGKAKEKKYPKMKYITWSLDTFLDEILKHDVAFVAHGNLPLDKARSNNRLLLCMSLGIPVITTASFAYKKDMRQCHLDKYIIKEKKEIRKALKSMADKKERENISKRMIEYSWKNYSPQKCSYMFMKAIENALEWRKKA